MTNDEVEEIIEKLRYQVKTLGEAIDHGNYPIQALVIEMDWGSKEMSGAHDIFERWDTRLAGGGTMQSGAFEADFGNELNLTYQGLKSVVLAFYKNGLWTSVCEAYVDSLGPSPALEYHSIMRRER